MYARNNRRNVFTLKLKRFCVHLTDDEIPYQHLYNIYFTFLHKELRAESYLKDEAPSPELDKWLRE